MTIYEAICQLARIVENMAERQISDITPDTDDAGIYGEKCGLCDRVTTTGTNILHEADCPIRQVKALLRDLQSSESKAEKGK